MVSKSIALGFLIAYAEARFGQEQVPVAAIQALSNFGNPGEAATLAGSVPGSLLAAANACAQVQLADKIVATLGNDPQVIAAAAQLVAAEKNFNPFAVDIPSICNDANLPATAELRGIVPLVDPAVAGSDVQNANSAASLKTPFNANGLSIADVSAAQGFSNFTAQGSDGSTAAAGGAAGNGGAAANNGANNGAADNNNANNGAADNNNANNGAADNNNANNGNQADTGNKNQNGAATQCGGGKNKGNNNGNNNGNANNNNGNNNGNANNNNGNNNGNANNNNGNNNGNANNNNNGDANNGAANNGTDTGAATGADTGANAGANTGAAAGTAGLTVSSNSALDFGTCNPAMSFVAGRANRAANEFTFNSVDPRILSVQQEALNPNIITNRICDEVQNRCNANAAAIQACNDAKASLLAKDVNTVKVAATATNWNAALGFENVDISKATV